MASTVLVGYIFVGSLLGRVMGDTTYGQLALFNEVVRLVLDAYVEPVNVDRAMSGARQGLTEALDGDSAYLDPEEYRIHEQPPPEREAEVGVVLSRRYPFLLVVTPRAGSPAEKAGVKAGDLVKSIDGRHTRFLSVPVGQRLLRGAPGSVVKLVLLRSGADSLELSVVRERMTPLAPRSKLLAGGSGYLKVDELSGRAPEEIRAELEALKRGGARNLVLDLRGAAFGVPADGIKVAELFLKGGVVAKLAGRTVPDQVFNADPSRSAWELPMAALVDNTTAGPGEIVAAALLDSGRSPLVGERTLGRAPLQRTVVLPEGALLLTVARYLTPKGTAIHGKGVEPTVRVESLDEEEDETEGPARDPVLEKALEILNPAQKKAA